MPRLYELTTAYNHIDQIIDNPDVSNEEIVDWLKTIEGEIKVKSENIAKLVENLETTSEAMKAAEGRLSARRKAIENKVKTMKSYLLMNIVAAGIHSIECEYFKIAVRDNPASVVIEDEKLIPAEYLRTPEPPPAAPDKKKILEDLKEGVVIEGVRIGRGQHLDIK